MYTCYMGKNLGVIHSFPFDTYMQYNGYKSQTTYKKAIASSLHRLVKNARYKYLVAITANKWQKHAAEWFKAHRFIPIVEFYSSHKRADETLTVWLRVRRDIKSTPKEQLGRLPTGNCSVSFYTELPPYYSCLRFVVPSTPKVLKQLKERKYKRLGKSPAWFLTDVEVPPVIPELTTILEPSNDQAEGRTRSVGTQKTDSDAAIVQTQGQP